jgi:hypothetical protein
MRAKKQTEIDTARAKRLTRWAFRVSGRIFGVSDTQWGRETARANA